MKVVSSSYGDATHPCRDCRVAKPFSADALRRKGEREEEGLKEEASEADGRVGRFMVSEHVNRLLVRRPITP